MTASFPPATSGTSVEGQIFLVTGAAAGIRRQCARWLAQRGARVALMDRDDAAAAVAAEELLDSGAEVRATPANIRSHEVDPDDFERVLRVNCTVPSS